MMKRLLKVLVGVLPAIAIAAIVNAQSGRTPSGGGQTLAPGTGFTCSSANTCSVFPINHLTYNWPASQSSNTCLHNNGSGALTWGSCGTSLSLTPGRIPKATGSGSTLGDSPFLVDAPGGDPRIQLLNPTTATSTFQV